MNTIEDSAAALQPGDLVAGKYRVERLLGAGGMGIVVAARHEQLHERVAIKFLLPEAAGSPEAVSQFLGEARKAVRIKSDHVTRVFDVGVQSNGAPYIVMEYLDGQDLAGLLKQQDRLPVEQAVDFLLQACVAIAHAHSVGIVHRDIKPANLFCVRRHDRFMLKVLDFGISKMTDTSEAAMSVTRTGTIMGSPLYMSPEQMRSSKDVDGRTDIWSLGIVFFELLTGRTPYTGASLTEIVLSVATDPPLLLRTELPDAPAALELAIGRCLEKDRRLRYSTVAELAHALTPFGSRRAEAWMDEIRSVESSSAAVEIANPPPTVETAHPRIATMTFRPVGSTIPTSTRSARPWRATLAGAAFISLLAAFAWKRSLSQQSPPLPVSAQAASSVAPAGVVTSAAASFHEAREASQPLPRAVEDAAELAIPPKPAAHPVPVVTSLVHPLKAPLRPGKVAPTTAAPATAEAPNCSPPYTIDASGHRLYKPECP